MLFLAVVIGRTAYSGFEGGGKVLGIGIAEDGGDFLDGHDGSGEETLSDADFLLSQILHGGIAEFLLEYPDDVHFGDAEVFRDDIEGEVVVHIGVDIGADFLIERIFFIPVGEERIPVGLCKNFKQQTGDFGFDPGHIGRQGTAEAVMDGKEQIQNIGMRGENGSE